MALPFTCWKRALRDLPVRLFSFFTVFRSSLIAGAKSCCPSRQPVITSSRPTCAVLVERRDGTIPMNADPDPFRILGMVRDSTALVHALGHRNVAMIVGHDAGAPIASWAALIRPDV